MTDATQHLYDRWEKYHEEFLCGSASRETALAAYHDWLSAVNTPVQPEPRLVWDDCQAVTPFGIYHIAGSPGEEDWYWRYALSGGFSSARYGYPETEGGRNLSEAQAKDACEADLSARLMAVDHLCPSKLLRQIGVGKDRSG